MTERTNVPISKKLILINSMSGIVTRLLTVGVFAWVIQHLMKRIPDSELQLLPIVTSVAMILPFLQTIFTAGLSRHVTAAYARHDLAQVTAIVSSQFPLLVGAAAVAAVVTGFITYYIDRLLRIPPEYVGTMQFMLILVAVRLIVGMVLVPFNTGLFAKQRFVIQNAIEVVGSIIRMALMLGLVLLAGPKVEWVIIAMVGSQLFVTIATTIVSMASIPELRYHPASFSWEVCKENISFGLWYFVLQVAAFIRRAADAPILNRLANPVAVNDFFLGSVVDTQLREMSIRATIPLLPALTAMHARDEPKRLAAAYLRGARIALWTSMLLATPLMVFSYDLFRLYLGTKYQEHADAATVMIIMLMGIMFTNSASMFNQIAQARADIRPVAIRAAASQVGNLILTLILVGVFHMGAIGSALGTLISFVVINPFFNWPLALRTLDLTWRRFLGQSLIPGLLPTGVAALVGWISMLLIGDSSLMRVLIGIPLCVMAYGTTLLLSLKPSDRSDLQRLLGAVIPKLKALTK